MFFTSLPQDLRRGCVQMTWASVEGLTTTPQGFERMRLGRNPRRSGRRGAPQVLVGCPERNRPGPTD
jgi:hypothetical protein